MTSLSDDAVTTGNVTAKESASASLSSSSSSPDVDPFQYVGKVKGRRKGPYPNSILDRKAFTEALDEAGIHLKPIHMDAFYQTLHRQHYPSLSTFVDNYYADEDRRMGGAGVGSNSNFSSRNSSQQSLNGKIATTTTATDESTSVLQIQQQQQQQPAVVLQRPLKNAVTNRKNRNKQQLPKRLLEYLRTTKDFVTSTSTVRQQLVSKDRSTTKLIVELHDGFQVESVLMRYDQKGTGRASLCVSSQCGCAMGCTFCATGTMGLSGNLTTGEILEQLVHADRILADEWLADQQQQQQQEQENTDPEITATTATTSNSSKKKNIELVRNVVFMGMGEPLDNYTNVTEACRAMIDRNRWNLAHGRVTVSTVGLISQIRRLTKELPEVSLALSLHAPNQTARTAIVPTATRYPIEGLIDALDSHMMAYLEKRKERLRLERQQNGGSETNANSSPPVDGDYTAEERIKESSRRRAMIEYVMLEGETSSFECAHQLGKLCENRHLVVNLIPYNATDVKDKLRCPSPEHMSKFKEIVQSYGTFCTIRRTMGADIASACGQLVKKDTDKPNVVNDIEDTLTNRKDAGVTAASVSKKPLSTKALPRTKTVERTREGSMVEKDSESHVDQFHTWLDQLSMEDLEKCATVLAAATATSALLFVASAMKQTRIR